MIEKRKWLEFRKIGLLWFINTILHLFGWAIVLNIENGDVTEAYPARVKFRGFSEKCATDGYMKLSEYLRNNIDEIAKDISEVQEDDEA